MRCGDRNSSIPQSRVLPEKPTGPQLLKKFIDFMEPKGLLQHSQEPATCPSLEFDRIVYVVDEIYMPR